MEENREEDEHEDGQPSAKDFGCVGGGTALQKPRVTCACELDYARLTALFSGAPAVPLLRR